MTTLQRKLNRLGACYPAIKWARGKTARQAWSSCQRPGWLAYVTFLYYSGIGDNDMARFVRDYAANQGYGFRHEVDRRAAKLFRERWSRPILKDIR